MTYSATSENLKIYDVEFPVKGPIKKIEGFIFIKIDDEIRQKIFEALKKTLSTDSLFLDKFQIPKPDRCVKDIGAHVSVIDLTEKDLIEEEDLESLKEDTMIVFDKIIGIKKIDHAPNFEHLWILELESKQLEQIRRKTLGLSNKPNNDMHNFHLSIAEVPWHYTHLQKTNPFETRNEDQEPQKKDDCTIL